MKTELEKIRQLSETSIEYNKGIIKKVDLLLSEVHKDPIENLRGHREGNHLIIAWDYNEASHVMDLEYYAPGIHEEWQHSYARYREPLSPKAKKWSIGVGINKPFKVRAVIGEWISEPITIQPADVNNNPGSGGEQGLDLPEIDREIWFGWWDAYKAGEARQYATANMLTAAGENWITDELQYSEKVIPMIGGFGATGNANTDHLIKQRAGSTYRSTFEKFKDKIAYGVVQDEPWSRGKMTNKQVKLMMDSASVLPVPIALTITRATVFDESRIIPDSTDIVQVQAFPFFRDDIDNAEKYPQVKTRQNFLDYWETILTAIRKKAPGRPVVITAQGFSNNKWGNLPVESPMWYAELASIYDFVIGFIWYAWHDKSGATGLNHMPDVYESVKDAYRYLVPA